MSTDNTTQKELRCFIGLEIPVKIKKLLATEARNLQNDSAYADFKWVKKSNYHLTLHFLGEIPLNKVVELKKSLEDAPIIDSAFDLNVTSIVGFPSAESPKFIVAEIQNSQALNELHQAIQEKITALGITADNDTFRPHVSLARLKRGHKPPATGNILDINSNMTIETYSVFKSTLTPEGSLYEVIGEFGKPKPIIETQEDE